MTEIERIVLEWAARFIEKGGDESVGSLRLIVPGEGSWRFSPSPAREVRREPTRELDTIQVDCTVTVRGDDLLRWERGELNPQVAFSAGRIEVAGDGLVALRMNKFLGPNG